jgi:hypothetical protein
MIAEYIKAASELPLRTIGLGVGGITFFQHERLADEQVGYNGPDWKSSWLVVAREDTFGDPIFVDMAAQGLPVYTAIHGAGEWDPRLVAPSLSSLAATLNFVLSFCAKREHPVGLAANPMSGREHADLIAGITTLVGLPLPSFWQLLFESAP